MVSKSKISKVFRNWPFSIIAFDKTGAIVCANKLAQKYDPKLKTQKKTNIKDLFKISDDEFNNLLISCLSTNGVVDIKFTFKRRKKPHEHSFQAWRYELEEEPVIIISERQNLNDVCISKTQRKKTEIDANPTEAEEKLKYAIDQLRDIVESRDNFIHHISHEFRTPLNAIIGMSEMMMDEVFGQMEPHYASYAADIHNCGKTLLNLVQDILWYKEHAIDNSALTNIGECITSCITSVRPIVENKHLLLETAGEHLPKLKADHNLIERILFNIISNAVKFTPEGGKIKITPEYEANGEFCIVVSDTGVGIRKKDLDHIFEPFFRTQNAYIRNSDGLGLGLAVTKRSVEMLGGYINIFSKPGKGTTARVCFPSNVIENVQQHYNA